jgi:hypothetical protein
LSYPHFVTCCDLLWVSRWINSPLMTQGVSMPVSMPGAVRPVYSNAFEKDVKSRKLSLQFAPKPCKSSSNVARSLHVSIITSWFLSRHPPPTDETERKGWVAASQWSEEECKLGINFIRCQCFPPLWAYALTHIGVDCINSAEPYPADWNEYQWVIVCSTAATFNRDLERKVVKLTADHHKISEDEAQTNLQNVFMKKNAIWGAICVTSNAASSSTKKIDNAQVGDSSVPCTQWRVVSSLRFNYGNTTDDAFRDIEDYDGVAHSFALQNNVSQRMEALRKKIAKKKFTWAIEPPGANSPTCRGRKRKLDSSAC